MGTIIGRAIGYFFLGAIALPLALLPIMIVVYMLDSRCGSPGDSGGCEMGIASVELSAIPIGALLGLAFGIWRGIKARHSATT